MRGSLGTAADSNKRTAMPPCRAAVYCGHMAASTRMAGSSARATPEIPAAAVSTRSMAYARRLLLLAFAAISGAALVHLIAYHLDTGDPHGAIAMLAQCPLGGVLVLTGLCALSVSLAVAHATRRLSR